MQKNELAGMAIQVRGIVQGVGFRPFVYQLADKHHLTGWVCNSSNGVEIEINGKKPALQAFLQELKLSPPPLARIDELLSKQCNIDNYTQFTIIESKSDPSQFIPVSPDISICPDCLQELFDPPNRRYRYPFINCTNCGPRFTIIKDIPYDRPLTTMADFQMCPDCQAEYQDPLDRRFHAQPIACPVCGPELTFIKKGEMITGNNAALISARSAIKQGQIMAVKGLGGFHLACDATNQSTVRELRNRKKRIEKPFALMAFSVDEIRSCCEVSMEEQKLLESPQHPIVLLKRRQHCVLPVELAPGQTTLGFMLPYTPMHYLLMEQVDDFPNFLVMTSGNLSEEPIAYKDDDARERLSSLADGFLTHNREIHMRVDDSVMRVVEKASVFTRRSRGFAPDPFKLPFSVQPLLAVGAELKNHFTLTRDSYAFHSHYIGDLENYETLQSFEQGIVYFEKLFRITPELIVCDLHPDYLSTRYAQTRSNVDGIPMVQIQHHHAHLAACLIENNWDTDEPVIGLTFDGTGYGSDGTIWGGEVLVGGYQGYQRRFHLDPFLLPGGDKSVRVPARTALALLHKYQIDWDEKLPSVNFLNSEELNVVKSQLINQINSPFTSSIGRLFDAVSSLIGIRQQITYEGQAAIELETIADPYETNSYEFKISDAIFDPQPLITAILHDQNNHVPAKTIAARFHNGLAAACLSMCNKIRQDTNIKTVVLS
ncbi:MAG TPA: carbamoyltransferase HypF, partial [Leptolinea sp.]